MPDLIVGGAIVVLSFAACIGYTVWLLYGALTDNPAVVCDDPAEAAAAEWLALCIAAAEIRVDCAAEKRDLALWEAEVKAR